jgi:hypothetical protein
MTSPLGIYLAAALLLFAAPGTQADELPTNSWTLMTSTQKAERLKRWRAIEAAGWAKMPQETQAWIRAEQAVANAHSQSEAEARAWLAREAELSHKPIPNCTCPNPPEAELCRTVMDHPEMRFGVEAREKADACTKSGWLWNMMGTRAQK